MEEIKKDTDSEIKQDTVFLDSHLEELNDEYDSIYRRMNLRRQEINNQNNTESKKQKKN